MGGTVRHSMRSLGNLQIEIEAARSAIEFETLQIASASTPAPRRGVQGPAVAVVLRDQRPSVGDSVCHAVPNR